MFSMSLLHEIAAGLPDASVETICVGLHWTAVVVELDGERRCGLASNPLDGFQMDETLRATILKLMKKSSRALVAMASGQVHPFTSIGLAAINALLPRQPQRWVDRNASQVIAERGQGRKVVLVGHFPFVPEIQPLVGELHVLELRPQSGDLHASQAPSLLPTADLVAITSMAFVNGTLEGLLALCPPTAYVIVLGPSTPLSPLLFNHGIHMLCGSIVEKIDPVLDGILTGKGFRQIRPRGVRLVTVEK
jgi:uncharacterized protein (DUF4213/DUF364 family)